MKTLLFLLMLLLIPLQAPAAGSAFIRGRVIDSVTGSPIPDAFVTAGAEAVRTDRTGAFMLAASSPQIRVRAYGYRRAEQTVTTPLMALPRLVRLTPVTPKAVYLSFYGIGSRVLRENALKLLRETELNAVVIDIKGDRGMIPYPSSISLAHEAGAQKIITVRDMKALIGSLKQEGIYTIARIVVFKDNLLALLKPDWAVKSPGGGIWKDREGLAWVDPFRKEVHEYNAGIAVEAAGLGFDEIQFDYVRFPDAQNLLFSMPNNEENRVKAISGFLSETRKKLEPANVFVSADIFGYVFWNSNDTNIGQRLEDIALAVDYLAPMLYPSGFQFGIPGFRNPVAHPHEIVFLTLQRARQRTGLDAIRFRPWLQAFRDYAFDKRHFSEAEIKAQISAAEQFGSGGWMLWNPNNVYIPDGLKKE
ncbi:MAG: GTP-binding protein [Nitrospirae bacterium]|nr:MAG: GTP-binding protein [Nitrospirota bacterium]